MMDPFYGLNEPVVGERFVGRAEYVEQLQEFCTSRNFSIVGLPRVGKTSLAVHSILYQRDKVKLKYPDYPLCVLMFEVGGCATADDFFNDFTYETYMELKKAIPESNIEDHDLLKNAYTEVEEKGFKTGDIKRFFTGVIKIIAVNLVVIIDEFDIVRRLFSGNHYNLLRSIVCVHNIHVVITSKRQIKDIEREVDGSIFYQSFSGKDTIFLKPFGDQELEAYWKRLEPYFEAVSFPCDEKYRRMASFLTGNHPHKLDLLNDANYNAFKRNGSLLTDEEICHTMEEAFQAEFHVLQSVDLQDFVDLRRYRSRLEEFPKSENLLDAAVQTIIGPVYDLTDEMKNKLKDYGFLREVSEAEKLNIIGTNMGLIFQREGNLRTYIAPSDYCTLYMKKCFINNPPFWPKWTKTFRGLRRIVERFLILNWGEDWYDRYEFPELERIRNIVCNGVKKDLDSFISVSPHIEYLNESALCMLLKQYWNDVFRNIFTSMDYKAFFDKFYFIMKIRNHPAHNNDLYLSEKDREKANGYMDEIERDIDNWLSRRNDQDLKLHDIVETSFTSIEEPGMSLQIHNDNLYEGIIVLVHDKNDSKPYKDIKCAAFPWTLRIADDSWQSVDEGDKVSFNARQKDNRWWVAVNVKKQ